MADVAFWRYSDSRDFTLALPEFDWTKSDLAHHTRWLLPRVREIVRQFVETERAIPTALVPSLINKGRVTRLFNGFLKFPETTR